MDNKGDCIIMKKILIIAFLFGVFTGLEAICACPLSNIIYGQKSCSITQQQNQTIEDKLIPNKLNQMVSPTQSTSQEFRKLPHSMPETINIDKAENPEAEEGNKPYNAACQFGLCLPGENNGRK